MNALQVEFSFGFLLPFEPCSFHFSYFCLAGGTYNFCEGIISAWHNCEYAAETDFAAAGLAEPTCFARLSCAKWKSSFVQNVHAQIQIILHMRKPLLSIHKFPVILLADSEDPDQTVNAQVILGLCCPQSLSVLATPHKNVSLGICATYAQRHIFVWGCSDW